MREELASLFRAALAAVEPAAAVMRCLAPRRTGVAVCDRWGRPRIWLARRGRLLVVGAGKASAAMSRGVAGVCGTNVAGGAVVVPGRAGRSGRIRLLHGGHPLPTAGSARGTQAVWRILRSARHHDGVLFLLSGGASSLLVRPAPGLTLADKVVVTRLLLESGASIHEMNVVRKQLSEIKGGGALRAAAPASVATLIVSDVIGDHPATVGSGPTVFEGTGPRQAWRIIDRYGLRGRLPLRVLRHLEASKRRERCAPRLRAVHVVVAGNRDALGGAAALAQARGWRCRIERRPLSGDTRTAARAFAARVRALARAVRAPTCLLAGGETTVAVSGSGRGGRNQEFALAMAGVIAGEGAVTVLSAGTDGVDGPTKAAGAFVDGTTIARARAARLDPEAALAGHDSHGFFAALNDLFVTGPTGTNVMDIKIVLIGRPVAEARVARVAACGASW